MGTESKPKNNGIYKCWKITGNFNHAMESCAQMHLDSCPDLAPYKKCPMDHKVLF